MSLEDSVIRARTKPRPTTFADIVFAEARKGEITTAMDLLRDGADPNAIDRYGSSALSRAVQYDCVELVRALIAAGATVSQTGVTPLMNAKSPEVTEAFLAAGADINAVKTTSRIAIWVGQSALMSAAQMGRLPVVETLLAHGANRDLRDREGGSALMLAAMNGHDAVVQALVSGGASIDLEEAAVLNDVARMEELLRAGSEHSPDKMGRALWWAAGRGQNAAVECLLDFGADPDARHQRSMTALIHAALWGRTETLSLLLSPGASVNATDDGGRTALLSTQTLTYGNQVESVRVLLAGGANVDQASNTGWTPLISAALGGATECAEVLIEHGADVNAVNGFDEDGVGGYTALLYAVMNSRTAIVDLLIRSGGDVNSKGLQSRTPLEIARQRMRRPGFDPGIILLLEQAGAISQ